MKKKKEKKNSEGKSNRIDNIFTIILSICDVIAIVVLFLLYGPYPNFRNWLVTTAMTTMSHQYFATTFYSEDKINKVLEFLTEKFVMPDTAEYIIEDLNIMTSN